MVRRSHFRFRALRARANKGGMGKAAAYLRVSSGSQSLASQRDALRRAARARGDAIARGSWFAEKASSGRLARPELDRLRAAVRAGEYSRIYVFRIDRLTRSGIRDTFEVVEELRRHGAELVSIGDGFAVEGPAADVVLAVLAWAAQMERAAIGERVKAARKRVESQGGRWGRPARVDARTLARARALQKEGRTIREIAMALKVPRSTLGDALAGRGRYA